MQEPMRLIQERRGDAVVLPTMMGGRAWRGVSHDESLDLPITGAMGKASSVALGLCMAMPDKRVIVVDGDGSLLMNLGTLVTVAGQAPTNLYHFVLDNGVYAVTGGQPVPNAGGHDFAEIGRAAGYAATFLFDELEQFAIGIDAIMATTGPVLVSIKVEPDIETAPIRERSPIRRTPEAIKGVIERLRGEA